MPPDLPAPRFRVELPPELAAVEEGEGVVLDVEAFESWAAGAGGEPWASWASWAARAALASVARASCSAASAWSAGVAREPRMRMGWGVMVGRSGRG